MKVTVLILFLFSNFLFSQNKITQNYIDENKYIAIECSEKFSIPVEIILGIAIIESGSGQSKIAKKLKNHFGIVGKNKVNYKTRYKQYSNKNKSYLDFCKLIISKKIYSKLKKTKNYKKWIIGIANSNYSEKPKLWQKNLNRTITIYNLHEIKNKENYLLFTKKIIPFDFADSYIYN